MKPLPTYKLESSFFDNMEKGTEFIGKLKGFRPSKNYWIGICELKDITKETETGETLNGTVDFILCKKSENTISGLFELKHKKMKLTFKGFSKKGYPIFFS